MTATSKPNENFESGEHALVSGLVLGLAWKHSIDLMPVIDDDGNYTNRYEVGGLGLPEGTHVYISVEPPTKDKKCSMHPTPTQKEQTP